MTREEIFTEFVKHLSQQNTRASELDNPDDGCMYRAELDGKTYKCAVGFFIPDSVYSPSMEGQFASSLVYNYIPMLPKWMPEEVEFLGKLQHLHDTNLPGSIYRHWTPFTREHVKQHLLEFAAEQDLPQQTIFDHFPVNPPA